MNNRRIGVFSVGSIAIGSVLSMGLGGIVAPTALALPGSTNLATTFALTASKATSVSYTVMPVWYSVQLHKSSSMASAVVGKLRPRQKVTGTLSPGWPGWLRTSNGYVDLGVLSTVAGKTPKNGVLTTLKLCPIPLQYNTLRNVLPNYTPKTPRYFNCDAMSLLKSLETAYRIKFGHWAQIDLAFRSYAEQEYWYKKYGYPTAAKPGTSNHGWGLAIDFSDSQGSGKEFKWGGPGFKWLKANGARFGLNSPFAYGTNNESYHWDFVG